MALSRGLAAVVACAVAAAPSAHAQSLADTILSSASAEERGGGCAILRVDFAVRVQYQSHFPAATGDELRIQIAPLDRPAGSSSASGVPQTLTAPRSEAASVQSIEVESAGPSATLKIYFKRNVAFKVAQGIDFKSVLIAVSKPGGAAHCAIDQSSVATGPAPTGNGLRPTLADANKTKVRDSGPLTSAQQQELLAEVRAALEKKSYDRAVQLATKLTEQGAGDARQEAQELLGLARDKRGQQAHARAEYQEYLGQYPSGPGAERVRARLAELEAGATVADRNPALAAGNAQAGTAGDVKLDAGRAAGAGGWTTVTSEGTHLPSVDAVKPAWNFTQYGSLSAYYNLNQGGRSFIETPRTDLGWSRDDPYRTYQSAFLNTVDYDARFENADYWGRFKFSAIEQTDMLLDYRSGVRVSSLYFDGRLKDTAWSGSVGRQSATTGGVLGRYDGGSVGYLLNDWSRVHVVGGSPVERAEDAPFQSHSYFFGGGIDFSLFAKAMEMSFYGIEQRYDGLVDRRALGWETRYVKDGTAAYTTMEYDAHFGQLNSSTVSLSQLLADQSAVSMNLDFRRAPLLLASNALQGQGIYSLSELLQRYTVVEVDQLALDRTAKSVTATVALSKRLNDWLQWNTDLTINYLSGMPASGGVGEVPSTGTAYYFSSQLYASGLFTDRDSANGGLRYAYTLTSDRYMVDAGYTYPVTKELRVNPILRLGYAEYRTQTRHEYQAIPSVRTTYVVRPETTLELELGGKLMLTNSNMGRELQNEFLVLAGVRWELDR